MIRNRKISFIALGIAICGTFFLLSAPVTHATGWDLSGHRIIDSFESTISGTTRERGYTAMLQNREAMFAIHPNISSTDFNVRVDSIDLLPGGTEHVRANELHVGPIIEVHHTANTEQLRQDFTLRIKVNRGGRYLRIWLRKWNPERQTWERIRNQLDDLHQWAVANITEPGIYAAFESTQVEEGLASWFRDSRALVVAHNGYPMGSRIRVTNLDNARSIVVTVVSRGPYHQGRVVDLSYDAFAAIANPGAGVARVGVWPVDNVLPTGQVLGATVTREESQTSVASQPLVGNKNVDSSIRARSYANMNVQTGEIVSAKNADQKYPLASLTKLMTALVFLDQKVDWNKTVTFDASNDDAIGARLNLSNGDSVKVRDLWNTMLVGSANNAAKLIRKSTGLSVEAFRSKMNEKARSLGLSTLFFFEPTGLDLKNIGSASDYVRLAKIAFDNAEIKSATLKATYTFREAGDNELHTINNKNRMLTSGWQLEGTKTGYTDEAAWCLVTEVIGKTTNKNVIAIILGSPSDPYRYSDMGKALYTGF